MGEHGPRTDSSPRPEDIPHAYARFTMNQSIIPETLVLKGEASEGIPKIMASFRARVIINSMDNCSEAQNRSKSDRAFTADRSQNGWKLFFPAGQRYR